MNSFSKLLSIINYAKCWGTKELSRVTVSAPKSSIRRFVITEKAPTRAISWLKAATTAFTFKKLLRHNAKPNAH